MKVTSNFQAAIENAMQLASRTGGVVFSEQMLYGLASDMRFTSAKLLAAYGISAERFLQTFSIKPFNPEVRLSDRFLRIRQAALEFGARLGGIAGTAHLLYALLLETDSVAFNYLVYAGVDIEKLKADIVSTLQNGNRPERAQVRMDDIASEMAQLIQNVMRRPNLQPEDPEKKKARLSEDPLPTNMQGRAGQRLGDLEKFGVDLTKRAMEGKLDPVIGRGKEIERIIQVLCRRTKNNPVLIGEPGVGKSAIVEGLALAIVNEKVPDILRGKTIFSLDMASIVAGTRFRGDFEERFKNALNTIKDSGNIILFIDEIHTIIKAGASEGALDAANILKPLLARGELQTIGATTIDEYRKYIESDAALERRFQPIIVEQPSVSETIEILKGLRQAYEDHHKVKITDEAITAAAVLSDRYITDRFLPDKAIDLVDEAASRRKIYAFTLPKQVRELEEKIKETELEMSEASRREQFQLAQKLKTERDRLLEEKKKAEQEWAAKRDSTELIIGEDEIAEIVANQTGVPVKKLTETEAEKLLHLADELKKRVIGQDEAVESIAQAIKRARAGLKEPKRPIGSFIFLGPTGVGKTELSKALAEAMFGDEDLMIRVDMSEYMTKENVSKMIGSAPGYVGYDEGGQLTEKVRRKPYSVVLFDEIEKAHPDVFNLLLQILDDGRLTDSHGRTVNFKNTIIIMTSNAGATEIKKSVRLGFSGEADSKSDYERMKEVQTNALKSFMRPEFLNRVDDIIVFKRLSKESVGKICDLMLTGLKDRLGKMGITITVTDAAKEYVTNKGFDEEYGARPLRRTIQALIEDKLSEDILSGKYMVGDSVTVDADSSGLSFFKSE